MINLLDESPRWLDPVPPIFRHSTHSDAPVSEKVVSPLVNVRRRIVNERPPSTTMGPATEIYHEPRHAYTLGLLESVPRLDAREGRLIPIEGSPPDLTNLPVGCAFGPRCRFATDQCREERPELVEVAPDHLAACWHFDEVLVEAREKTETEAEA